MRRRGVEPRIASLQPLCRGKRFTFAQAVVEYAGRRFRRDLLLHPGAVVILPLLGDKTIMLRQWRPGCSCWLHELPAGTIEEGEDPAETAARELEEETGYRATRIEHLASFYTSPGTSTEKIHAYIADGLVKTRQRLEEDEIIRLEIIPLKEAVRMAVNGEIEDAKTITTLLLYAARTGLLTEL